MNGSDLLWNCSFSFDLWAEKEKLYSWTLYPPHCIYPMVLIPLYLDHSLVVLEAT